MNFLAILASGIVAMAIGFLWYGPLFLKPWRDGHKFSEAKSAALKKSMPIAAGVSFVGYLITAYVLSLLLAYMNVIDVSHALRVTFLIWLGFPAMVGLMNTLYTGGSLVVYAIDTTYQLAYMLATAVIVTLWR